MFNKLLILCSVLLCKFASCDSVTPLDKNVGDKQFIYNTYKYDSLINVVVNNETEQIMDFSEESPLYRGFPTRVHVSTNDTVSVDHPIFITATQQKGVSSWELPLQVSAAQSSMLYTNMARTLCPHDAGPNITYVNRPQLTLSTFSASNVSVNVKLRRVVDFFVPLDQEVSVVATPSTPKYFYFSFDSEPPDNHTRRQHLLPRFNYTMPKSVILIVESDNDVCALISIQNNSCPVFDNEKDALYQGYHQTMTIKGGITLTQNMFPSGFYVMFIVKQTDDECVGANDVLPSPDTLTSLGNRTKHFRFRVIATISYKEYVIGALVTLALIFLVAILVTIVALPAFSCAPQAILIPVEDPNAEAPGPSGSGEPPPATSSNKVNDSDEDSLSDSIPEWPEPLAPLTVAGLSRAKPRAHNRWSDRYFWSALTVAVVYALPVIQLLYTYQRMVFQTGNQDLCYYNFLCAHPLPALQMSDFNHVLSNIGYVILGLTFMLQVRVRQRNPPLPGLGISQHSGLFYSMGLALSMEGLLSACYHLCPNKMNFQFDSSFMYVIAVISMVKLYQNRHPDVNASAHATFMLLALLIVIGLFGIMFPSVWFWVFFTILHLMTCLVLTVNIYYVGQFKLEWARPRCVWSALRRRRRPRYAARALLLALANAANWALAAYGLYMHKRDFARHLLAILMGNTILYTWFYVAMKLTKREKVAPPAWVYFVGAHVAWFVAGKLFLDSRTKWSESPAQSRRHNAVCSALQFYDSHDLWHVASAAALYLSFNLLLVIDDPLKNTPRDLIPVF
ncbi:SID1 transmembrane family member 1-like isoform X2 [Plodia interpunctella]|uniref:SID1 transmembrane family member 1-like isoform X2 n=1 Tax=Plodia interpunctella TaxID=58824 RepID=UPI002367539E|nr:SID1 transmembrane family member 1-like isoform X2 [Plodia interpunctella]